jgi:ADP-dependent NAD(P)H-hydrate dehydratase / NAD(P)H-hydrate epimerase
MKIVTVAQMQKAEKDCSSFGISLSQLMENAGRAVADEIRRLAPELSRQNILVLVGPGNNGGDGLVAARHLIDWGAGRVKILTCGNRPAGDPNLSAVLQKGIHLRELEADYNLSKYCEWLSESTIVLDAFFGTGKSRKLEGLFAEILKGIQSERSARPDLKLIALDLPSGVDADTGSVDPATPHFDYTITLGFPKTGLFNLPAAEYTGHLSIVDIGIPYSLVDGLNTDLLEPKTVKNLLPARPPVSHKGTFGRVLALTGSINYPGAALMSCAAALRCGAGLVTLAAGTAWLPMVAARIPEITYLPLGGSTSAQSAADNVKIIRNHLPQYTVLLLGCGLGQSASARETTQNLVLDPPGKLPPLVLDADGLNHLAEIKEWPTKFKSEAVFTPHPAEMSRLSGLSIKEIQANRLETSRQLAQQWHTVVVLKGAYSVIASPEGKVWVSPFANAALASAGTGDVLAGAIAGLAAQGIPLLEAALTGVYIHALAAELLKDAVGDTGLLAGDLLPVLPRAIKTLKEK